VAKLSIAAMEARLEIEAMFLIESDV